ncbi:MAG: hypothetical protein AAF480_06960 [Actinomycetota bacterium]
MASGRHIVIVTCERWPDLSTSDAELAAELRLRGHDVAAHPWNAAPLDAFTGADQVVLRSNWDFHHDLAGFEDWLRDVDAGDAELHNAAELVIGHNDKAYLEELRALGVPTPRTLALDDFDVAAVGAWMDSHGYERAVAKPAWGASGHLVELVERHELEGSATRWRARSDGRGLMVQQFVPDIAHGEHALVFFGGEYSHALLRRPAADDFRVNTQYGGTMQLASAVDQTAIEFAAAVLDRLPTVATYARVDVVGAGAAPTLMELELNEPALGLHLAPGAAARFADALLRG